MKKAVLLSFLFLCCNNIIIAQNSKVPWMEGSWGVRLIMQAGSGLDNAIDNLNYDYEDYAEQINLNYPSAGHVIVNFSGNANGTIFTLRQNDNVDIAAEIDPTMVPSLANEQAIFDVINELKTGGKRVLLYMNFTPNMSKGTDSQKANWNTYVDANFSGSYITAYNDLMEGFIKRFKGLIDGYWIDNFGYGTDAEKDSFIQMLKTTDPNAVLSVNYSKSYFTGIEVDSDGTGDSDATDYKVIKYEANDIWSDYTGGHVTPIGQGAPSNSWGYDEFTVPDMAADNLTSVTIGGVSNNNVLKHMFTPIRERWTSPALPLLYDQDQAYRFVKKITDAGGAITFSTTTSTSGLPMPDELAVLTHVNDQFEINASYVPYVRPAGAYLVGETTPNYNQIIDFPVLPNKDVNDANFDPEAAASSGLTVSYTSSNTAVATIVGGNISIQGAGTTIITASQGGNGTFAAATNVTRQLTVTGPPTGNNLALSGTASQSTTAFGGVASRAIDGDTNGNFGGNSVTHTDAITNSYWQVDLGSDYNISNVNIFNRTDACCISRLSDFTLIIIDNAGNFNFSQRITSTPNPSLLVDVGGVTGKIVRIRSNIANTALSLAEVQVFEEEFAPDPNKTYYIDNPQWNLRLAADGVSDDPYTTATTTTGNDVEWKFVDNGNGYWHIDRAAGGTQPRLRTDGTANADMNQQGISANTYYELSEGSTSGTHFLTLPNATTNFKRLQINNASLVKMTNSTSNGTWESFTITEVSCATFSTIEAEDYDDMLSVVIGNSTDTGGGQKVGQIHNSDWCRYDDIDLTCATSVEARLASAQSGGSVEVRIDSVTGTLIGTISQGGTGGWQNWVTASDTNLTSVSGVHDVYLVFTGGNTALFNFNWFEFSNGSQSKNATNKKTPITEKDTGNSLVMYPNPVSNIITIDFRGTTAANIRIFDYSGKTIRSGAVENGSNTIDLSDLASGLYIIKVFNEKETYTRKLIKN